MATSFSNPDHDVNDWSLHSVAARRDSVIQPGKFTWTPLSKSEAEIRICRIKPGPEDSSIQVSLRNVKLKESAGQYTCLSYAWVNKRLTHGILLNDFYYPVPRNLHLQLSRLRVLCLTEDLWIDLVCIDQENDDERSQQVGLMGSIFSSANKVILGVDEGGRLQQPSTIEKALLSLSSGSHLHEFDCSACSGTEQNGELSTNTIAAKQVRRIIAASFWTRCWTVQEIVLAREVVVMGEWGIFPWSLLQEASQAYDSHRRGCCASFVDELAKDVRSRCYKVSDAENLKSACRTLRN